MFRGLLAVRPPVPSHSFQWRHVTFPSLAGCGKRSFGGTQDAWGRWCQATVMLPWNIHEWQLTGLCGGCSLVGMAMKCRGLGAAVTARTGSCCEFGAQVPRARRARALVATVARGGRRAHARYRGRATRAGLRGWRHRPIAGPVSCSRIAAYEYRI